MRKLLRLLLKKANWFGTKAIQAKSPEAVVGEERTDLRVHMQLSADVAAVADQQHARIIGLR